MSDTYQVLARKFRPQTFETIVGQEPIVTTLKNAITQKRIAQSFLFVGMRGVGKTSTARILAKALNCAKGPTVTPCNKCSACLEITAGNSLDVLEIDGASNRGIDEIRNLRETVKYQPTQGLYRIYIIDEVHMLTTEAFNALLKTLEEPPAHVKFIFATTESQKVPATIVSRCQRFDFRRMSTQTIVETLKEIAKKEKFKIEEDAIFLIAKAADGSMRDAESVLDKLTSFTKGELKVNHCIDALGLVAQDIYWKILDAASDGKAGEVIAELDAVVRSGKDLTPFTEGLFETLRFLLVAQSVGKKREALEDVSDEVYDEIQKRKDMFSQDQLLVMMSLVQTAMMRLKRASQPRYILELALVKLVSVRGLTALGELTAQLKSVKLPVASAAIPSAATPASVSTVVSAAPQRATSTAAKAAPHAAKPKILKAEQIEDIETAWAEIVEDVKQKKVSTGIFLSEAQPVEWSSGRLVIAFPEEFVFHKETVEKKENKQLIETILTQKFGQKTTAQFVVAHSDEKTTTAKSDEVPDIVESAIEMFQGKIIRR